MLTFRVARFPRLLLTALLLTSILLSAMPVPPAYAASYVDTFSTFPFSGTVTSFTTGTASEGLLYTFTSAGRGGYFSTNTWGGVGYGNGIELKTATNAFVSETITIESRSGDPFEFSSIFIDPYCNDITITGVGAEPFTMTADHRGSYAPPAGDSLVTRVELTSMDFFSDVFDEVSVNFIHPEMAVYGNSTLIANGDRSPASADDTDFGTSVVGTSVSRTFTISNIGDLPLTLSGASPYVSITNPATFSLTSTPSNSINTGGSTTFTVMCTPGRVGTETATVSIDNDSETTPYSFDISCTGIAPDPPGTPDLTPGSDSGASSTDNTTHDSTPAFTGTCETGRTVTLSSSRDGSLSPTDTCTTGSYDITLTDALSEYSHAITASQDGSAASGVLNITIDTIRPDVSLNQAAGQADPANLSPVAFTAVFDEPINAATFSPADVSISGTAATGTVTVAEASPHDGTTFSVSAAVNGDGTVTVTIPAGGVEDLAGNSNTASTNTDNSVLFDVTNPDVTVNQAEGQADPTNLSPVVFTAVFAEPINPATFSPADVSISGTAATGTVTVTEASPYDGTTFSISAAVSTEGTVITAIPAGGVEDLAGNTSTASTSTDNTVAYDTTAAAPAIPDLAASSDTGASSSDNRTQNSSPQFTGACETGATVTLHSSLDGDLTPTGICTDGTYDITLTSPLREGSHEMTASQVDAAGNTSPASGALSIDIITPGLSVNLIGNRGNDNLASAGGTPVPGAVDCPGGSRCAVDFGLDDMVTLNVTVDAGSVFIGWSGDCASFGAALSGSITMDDDQTCTATFAATEMDVLGNGYSIADEDATPSMTDDTDFGTGDVSSSIISHTFTIQNSGAVDLSLIGSPMVIIGGPNAADFSVTHQPVSPVSSGGTTTFTVAFDPRALGLRTATVSIANNDSDEKPYNFDIQGTGVNAPLVIFDAITSPANGSMMSIGPTQIRVEFDEDVRNDGSAGAANNPSNYMLFEAGLNGVFDTSSCASGLIADDTQITIDDASYNDNADAGPFIATLDLNNGIPLPIGSYRLTICGTTSIENLAGIKLNAGLADSNLDFEVVSAPLPDTGFQPGVVTSLPMQSELMNDPTDGGMMLEIPELDLLVPIVSVPDSGAGWDVRWLMGQAGYLEGTSFPTWNGNTVLTGHAYAASGLPGIFAELSDLQYGDTFSIHAWGQRYTYQVQQSYLTLPTSLQPLRHEELDWVTLITCHHFDEGLDSYRYRQVVRGVLIEIE